MSCTCISLYITKVPNMVTGQLADWSTCGLDKSRTGQLTDAIGDFACLVFAFGSICETASCPVRELSSYPQHNTEQFWQSFVLCSTESRQCYYAVKGMMKTGLLWNNAMQSRLALSDKSTITRSSRPPVVALVSLMTWSILFIYQTHFSQFGSRSVQKLVSLN